MIIKEKKCKENDKQTKYKSSFGFVKKPVTCNSRCTIVTTGFASFIHDRINNSNDLENKDVYTKMQIKGKITKENKLRQFVNKNTDTNNHGSMGGCVPRSLLQTIKHYYYFFIDNDKDKALSKFMYANHRNEAVKMIHFNDSKFKIVDSSDGYILRDSDGTTPIFILPKRDDVLKTMINASKDVQNLKSLLENQKKETRGYNRSGIFKNYGTFGLHSNRYSKGMHDKVIDKTLLREENHIKKMCRRMQDYAKAFLPNGILSSFEAGKTLCESSFNYPAKISKGRSEYSNVYSSIACSCNYMSSAHVNDDSFLTGITVSHTLCNGREKNNYYQQNQPIAVYFCFPEHGIAAGLRPGDIFFFNATHAHNASQRTEYYKNDDVYLTSFYVKNKEINQNDNNIIIPEGFIHECKRLDDILGTKCIVNYNKLQK